MLVAIGILILLGMVVAARYNRLVQHFNRLQTALDDRDRSRRALADHLGVAISEIEQATSSSEEDDPRNVELRRAARDGEMRAQEAAAAYQQALRPIPNRWIARIGRLPADPE